MRFVVKPLGLLVYRKQATKAATSNGAFLIVHGTAKDHSLAETHGQSIRFEFSWLS